MIGVNCVSLFLEQARARGPSPALWLPGEGVTTYAELRRIAVRAQHLADTAGVRAGDRVLLLESLGAPLYGAVIGLLGMGATVLLVEPWMPVARLEQVVASAAPRAFLSGCLGWLWGMRVGAVRRIPRWLWSRRLRGAAGAEMRVEPVEGQQPAILTFTSGTTGAPKGVVRTHAGLTAQHGILSRALGLEVASGADLVIFANFALLNLASGRPSVIVPPAWKAADLRAVDALPDSLQPRSLTCGPAFLERVMQQASLRRLEHLHIGGALTDTASFEAAFQRWPEAQVRHVYGSTEAEPVAVADARESVRHSRDRGLVQTLHLGRPVPEIASEPTPEGLWVTGAHTCPCYLGNDDENRRTKKTDAGGRIWHNMGDRVRPDADGWWYAGRVDQPPEDFALEQRIYAVLGSTASFVFRATDGACRLAGQGVSARDGELRRTFPELAGVVETTVVRDRRHRARIDRRASLAATKFRFPPESAE